MIPSVDVDLWDDEVLVDPYPVYADLRELGAVLYDPAWDVYVLPRYDEVRQAVQDWERFTSTRGVGVSERGNRYSGSGILTTEPPRHDELRAVMNRQLVPRSISQHLDFLDEVASDMVGELARRGTFDAVTDLARPYSVHVVSTLCGLPDEGREHFIEWASDGFNVHGPDNDLCNSSFDGFFKLYEYAFKVVTPDRLEPGRWGAEIYNAGAAGEIDAAACPGLLMAYVWAGMDTTVNALASAVRLFARHPDQWQLLRNDRSLLTSATAEILRIEPPVQRFTRVTTTDIDIDGAIVPEGARVVVLFGSANRDERRFPEPDRFDISRNPTDHLAFGRGIHRCVGAGLAQQEVKSVLSQLADRVDSFDIVDEAWRTNNSLHGLDRLVVTVR